ncbi:type IV secretion system protein VirB10 [Enhydrobacter aerosaccus]|uniref:Type IV secretion system protein VirB10 n=1 Tax=Enhydrobacter aerosaccus TaxID=225324 RepID=A0A1T4TIX9_9HYPH|nr:type IV secretion system protein VirB10 [Enhydrobacter aerosaccus]SKA40420.1 type IV secretion system protein VirB10 [Enhydrobacter aerosaccus]
MTKLGKGGGFYDREDAQGEPAAGTPQPGDTFDHAAAGQLPPEDLPPLPEGEETAAIESAPEVETAVPATPTLGAPGLRPGAAEEAPASAISAIAKKGRIPLAVAAGGTAVVLVLTMLYFNIRANNQPATPPEAPPTAPVVRPPDLMEPKQPPVQAATPTPLQPAAMVPPPKSKADDLAEKVQRAPLMAMATQGQQNPNANARPVSAANADRPMGQTEISRNLATTPIMKVKARNLGDPTLRLSAGTLVPCILDTAMDTTTAGFVRCHLEHDVYSANGTVVLLDAGTIVLGEYNSGLQQGQERIGVVWSRAETPNSVVIDLSSPAADSLGRGGMDGQIETYFWTRFGAAMMFSLLSDAGSIARAWAQSQFQQQGGNSTYIYGNMGSTTQQMANQVGMETLRQTLSIKPVLKKNQGERVDIFVRNDLDFSGVYSVSAR